MKKKVFDWALEEYVEVEVKERNGNLAYVEKQDGSSDWVSNSELEE